MTALVIGMAALVFSGCKAQSPAVHATEPSECPLQNVMGTATTGLTDAASVVSQGERTIEQHPTALPASIRVTVRCLPEVFLGRYSTFQLRIENTSIHDAEVVLLADTSRLAGRVMVADGGTEFPGGVSWGPFMLTPGGSREFELKVRPEGLSTNCLQAIAWAGHATSTSHECCTQTIGIPSPLFGDVDDPDPCQVGENCTYKFFVVADRGTQLTNVRARCEIDPKTMQLVSADGPTGKGQLQAEVIEFPPIEQLQPKERREFRVVVKAIAPGQVLIRFVYTAEEMVNPRRQEETTNFYR